MTDYGPEIATTKGTDGIKTTPIRCHVRLPACSWRRDDHDDVYAATIEQAVLADELGFDHVWFTEHHFLEDGYLPAFQPLAGAIAARTKQIRISNDIALLPLYHPIRLAEELAVLDQISNGRMEFELAWVTYQKFDTFGVPLRNRVSMTDEAIEILRLAWGEGPFSFRGKRYNLSNIDVHPKPVQPGGPPLWIAAMKEPGALRAARCGTNLLPQGRREEVLDPWRDAVNAKGEDPDDYRVGIIRSVYVTDDRERDGRRFGKQNVFVWASTAPYGRDPRWYR